MKRSQQRLSASSTEEQSNAAAPLPEALGMSARMSALQAARAAKKATLQRPTAVGAAGGFSFPPAPQLNQGFTFPAKSKRSDVEAEEANDGLPPPPEEEGTSAPPVKLARRQSPNVRRGSKPATVPTPELPPMTALKNARHAATAPPVVVEHVPGGFTYFDQTKHVVNRTPSPPQAPPTSAAAAVPAVTTPLPTRAPGPRGPSAARATPHTGQRSSMPAEVINLTATPLRSTSFRASTPYGAPVPTPAPPAPPPSPASALRGTGPLPPRPPRSLSRARAQVASFSEATANKAWSATHEPDGVPVPLERISRSGRCVLMLAIIVSFAVGAWGLSPMVLHPLVKHMKVEESAPARLVPSVAELIDRHFHFNARRNVTLSTGDSANVCFHCRAQQALAFEQARMMTRFGSDNKVIFLASLVTKEDEVLREITHSFVLLTHRMKLVELARAGTWLDRLRARIDSVFHAFSEILDTRQPEALFWNMVSCLVPMDHDLPCPSADALLGKYHDAAEHPDVALLTSLLNATCHCPPSGGEQKPPG